MTDIAILGLGAAMPIVSAGWWLNQKPRAANFGRMLLRLAGEPESTKQPDPSERIIRDLQRRLAAMEAAQQTTGGTKAAPTSCFAHSLEREKQEEEEVESEETVVFARPPVTGTIDLGRTTSGAKATIDLAKLMTTRMLLTATSGAGKTWTLRRILEQAYPLVQQIIFDVEGDLRSLADGFDYFVPVINSRNHSTWGPMAVELLKSGKSAIFDVYDLSDEERQNFVRIFLEALINAPKECWAPVIVALDESHIFASQSGQCSSREAVKALLTRGRKRGIAAILATQRLPELHKTVVSQCGNVLVGRFVGDNDVARAMGILGFTGAGGRARIRTQETGSFFCMGEAFGGRAAESVAVGGVRTKHG